MITLLLTSTNGTDNFELYIFQFNERIKIEAAASPLSLGFSFFRTL